MIRVKEVKNITKISTKICVKCGAELIPREGYWCRLCEASHLEESEIGKEHVQYKRRDPEAEECPECGYSHQIGPANDKRHTRSLVAPIKFPHLHNILLPLFLFSLCALVIAAIIVIFGIDFPWPVQVKRPWSQGGGTYHVEFPWIIVGAIMIFALVSYVYKNLIARSPTSSFP